MADRKETPDILGGLLGGDKKPKAPEEKKEEDSKPEYHNTGIPEHHNNSAPAQQQDSKPSRRPTSKTVSQKPKKSDKAVVEAADGSEESSVEKLKATYYLSIDVIDALEEGWIKLRRMASTDARTSISKSLIVETALQMALEELEKSGQKSSLAKRLLEE